MLLPLTLAALVSADAYRLSNGTSWSGVATLHFHSRAAEIDEVDRLKLSFLVTGKSDGLWKVRRIGEVLSTRISGQDIPPPPKEDPQITQQFVSPAGFLLDAEPFDAGQFYLDRMIEFWLPTNTPDSWTVDLSTDSDTHFVAKGHATFKVTRKAETSRQYSFEYNSVDYPTGISASGSMWFDVKTGRLLTAKIEAKQALIPGGTERVDTTISYTDSKVKQ